MKSCLVVGKFFLIKDIDVLVKGVDGLTPLMPALLGVDRIFRQLWVDDRVEDVLLGARGGAILAL